MITLLTGGVTLMLIALMGLLIAAALSPFESLGWWAGWFGKEQDLLRTSTIVRATSRTRLDSCVEHFVIFLSGIGSLGGGSLHPTEIPFLEYLHRHLPRTTVIHEVFPYSVINPDLTRERILGPFWRWLGDLRTTGKAGPVPFIINLRNLFQMLVSADARYGPIYNIGVAREIAICLIRHSYPVRSGIPVTLIGSSGGAQVALGASSYLTWVLGAPVRIISIGGTMSGDIGIKYVERLDHFYGTRDRITRLVGLLFPSRWQIMHRSAWNQAMAQGKIGMHCLGPMGHQGVGSYFDGESYMSDGHSYLEHTAQAIVAAIARTGSPVLTIHAVAA